MYKMTDKKDLRRHFKEMRISMNQNEKTSSDIAVFRNFVSSEEYDNCENLLIYVSSHIEVDTIEIISYALKEKNVFCPRCVQGTNLMDFCRIGSFDELKRGAFGIFEPVESCEILHNYDRSLCVVPALSYDLQGYRLGFGKGYYDRFLAGFSGVKIGLCYDCCMTKQLPAQEFDIKADMIITESKVIDFSAKKG